MQYRHTGAESGSGIVLKLGQGLSLHRERRLTRIRGDGETQSGFRDVLIVSSKFLHMLMMLSNNIMSMCKNYFLHIVKDPRRIAMYVVFLL